MPQRLGLIRRGAGLRAYSGHEPAGTPRRRTHLSMENIVIGLIALGCLVYLIVAVLHPEKF